MKSYENLTNYILSSCLLSSYLVNGNVSLDSLWTEQKTKV